MKILHKAKLKNKDHWIEGFYCSKADTTYCFKEDYERNPVETHHYIIQDQMTDWNMPNELRLYEINLDTLCVFTGMTDRDNKKIWENDIVVCQDIIGRIRWNETHLAYTILANINGNMQYYYIDESLSSDIKVIGNIFDNPELLEEK